MKETQSPKSKIQNMKIKIKKEPGFTLLELLVVIAIIGILVSLGVVSYSGAQEKARDAQRRADLKAVQSAFEQYYAANGKYPGDCTLSYEGETAEDYLPQGMPQDPRGGDYIGISGGSGCSEADYEICADLEGEGDYDGTEQDFCVQNLQ